MIDTFHQLVRSPVCWIVTVTGGYFLLLFFVSLYERQCTFPYIVVRPNVESDQIGLRFDQDGALHIAPSLGYADNTVDSSVIPRYVMVMSDDAYRAGFQFDKLLAHAKPSCKITATIWFSIERDILIYSGAGTVLNMPSFQTWLYSPLKDGRILVTKDNNDEGDRSGTYVTTRLIRQPFGKLIEAHRKRVEQYGAQVDRFREPTALDSLRAIQTGRVEKMVACGLARYRDVDQLFWSYSVWGSVRGCLGLFVQAALTLPQASRLQQKPIATHETVSLGQSAYERYAPPRDQ